MRYGNRGNLDFVAVVPLMVQDGALHADALDAGVNFRYGRDFEEINRFLITAEADPASSAQAYKETRQHDLALEWAERGFKAFPKRPDSRQASRLRSSARSACG